MGISKYKTAILSVTAVAILTVYVLFQQNERLELTYFTGESQEDIKNEMKQFYPAHKKHDGQVQYLQDATPKWNKRHGKHNVTSSSEMEQSAQNDEKKRKEVREKRKKNHVGAEMEDGDHADSSTTPEFSADQVDEQRERTVQMKAKKNERSQRKAKNVVESSDITDQSTSSDNNITDQSISDDLDQPSSNDEPKAERKQRVKARKSASAKRPDSDILHSSDEEKKYLLEHNRRIEHMTQVCNDREILEKRVYRGQSRKLMYISKAYNFSYCKVPKSGCTFWTQIFLILRNFSAVDVFGLKRFQVHQYSEFFVIPPNDPRRYTTRMILVSRDPYSRLYSAFIDKAFLGLFPTLCNRIRNQAISVCSHNVTFEEFLRYIIYRVKDNRVLNRHWAPIFSLCEPCKVNQYRLVKQESFSKDVDFILKELQIDPIKFKKITNALHDHRVEITIPGILDTVLKTHLGHTMLARCIGLSGVAKRLWTSFKIQGYIDERIDFPESQFRSEADFRNRTFLTQVILNTIKNNPLTSPESKKQRQRALVSAYNEVSAETIEDIKAIYKPDFVLFGYDTNLPSM